ncbi:glycosyltransferase family 25 protein [Lentilitoribacter sp. EG35]|uniref:glycosyltransferase family 25 protein n=1 Tax=Lentilitoribacter sp. EG35 TaxID=3234192 RepID=UPI003460B64A
MKALVINLKTAPERRKFQLYQLKELGIEFEFLDAETASKAPTLRSEEYWMTGVRPLKDTEKACLISHWNCWNKIVKANEPMLVLEDDAFLSIKTPQLLSAIKNLTGIDILNLETRHRRVLLKKSPEQLSGLYQLLLNRDGAAAYILWPSGAQKMIEKANRKAGIADAMLWTSFELHAYQMNPALALQSDKCKNYGISNPLETRSSIATDEIHPRDKPSGRSEYFKFRFRRFLEQLHLAQPMVFNYFSSEKKYLEIVKDDFDYLAKYKG